MTEHVDEGSELDGLCAVGISHRTSGLDALERLALSSEEKDALYTSLRERGAHDALVLSTCNRTEVYVRSVRPQDVLQALGSVVAPERMPQDGAFYGHQALEAARHLYRVATGLDSMILGEPQILGQLKGAFQHRVDVYGRPSSGFERLIQSSFKVAGRCRTDTKIGEGAISVASAAVQLSHKIFGDLSSARIMIVGAGETGRLLLEHFQRFRPKEVLIANRTRERAEGLAQAVEGRPIGLNEIETHLAQCDVVATAVSDAQHLIKRTAIESAIVARRNRPLAVLDLGLPRNAHPAIGELPNVFLHDLEALKGVVDQNASMRAREVPKAESIIEVAISRLEEGERVRHTEPAIAELRAAIEQARVEELARIDKDLPPAERDRLERFSRSLANRLAHGPTVLAKDEARGGDDERAVHWLSRWAELLRRRRG